MRPRFALPALACAALALPAASQQAAKAPPVNLYIDAATQSMAGMPDMGGMLGGLGGFLARRMGGAEATTPVYPTTRGSGGLGGQYLDVALHNRLRPGVEAQDQIPPGLRLGKALVLLPIAPGSATPTPERPAPGQAQVPDMELTIREYWGCGASVRPGQPKVSTIKVKGGTFDPRRGPQGMGIDVQATGSMSKGLYVPDRDIGVQPGYVYWPNPKTGKPVPAGASLAGEHRITGDGIPASMQFQVEAASDFMPKLALRSQGEPTESIALSWPGLAQAQAYFISGMHMQMQGENRYTLTVWSSAEVPGAGSELHTYLGPGQLDKWLKQKVLLPSTTTSCAIPRGIFAGGAQGQGREAGMPGMLTMTAYGPERWITYPPKPADPRQPWNPEWSVRLRTRSSTMAMVGMDFGGMGMPEEDGEQPAPQQKKPSMKGLLKGILGG